MAKKKANTEEQVVEAKAPDYREVIIPIVGITPLLCHRLTEEAKMEMLLERHQKMAGATGGKKSPKVVTIDDEFNDACYPMPSDDGTPKFGFPTSAFRLAVREAARMTKLPMTQARLTFIPLEEIVEIRYDEVRARVDKVGGTTPGKPSTCVTRAEFTNWSCDLPIEYDADFASINVIINLLQRAGRMIGVGAWRPERNGLHGRFKIAG
uniref:Uncharacterized protein n=1 Tax=viral metagenome TaxID=1070528 RepID=A0A6M3J2F4_9ZZZZ